MPNVRTLSTEDLRQRLGEGNGLQVWNVQTDQFFSGELIPRSRRVSLDTLEQHAASVGKGVPIVTYCGGPQCPQSREAAQKLTALGFTDVHVYTDGLEGWKTGGHEVVQTARQAASSPPPA
jgi:rhodanese-related sulfurtransferase